MNYEKTTLFACLILLLSSCSINKKIEGLWQIEKVTMADQEMTPIAKWTRIHKNNSQESGNGWFQHSIGDWEYDPNNKQIKLVSSNGLKDEYNGFTIINISKDKMLWSRNEEGQKVSVYFKRIEKLPQSPANQLLGAWKLTSEKEPSYLFFRWDQIVTNHKANQKKKYSSYKTHGHKQEVTFIHYENPLRQEVWTYKFENNNVLILLNEEKKLTYERTNYIPK